MQDSPQDSQGTQPPPPTPPPSTPPPSEGQPSPNRTIMLVLSYLGILALVPLLVEKDDPEVQWHAKHGIVLLVSWIILYIVLALLEFVPGVGWILGCALLPFVSLAILVVHIVCIVKALQGSRLRIPIISEYADRWQ